MYLAWLTITKDEDKRREKINEMPFIKLSKTLLDALRYWEQGYSSTEIARFFGVSQRTIQSKQEYIRKKLKLTDKREIFTYYNKHYRGDRPTIKSEHLEELHEQAEKIVYDTMDKCICVLEPEHINFEKFCSEEIANNMDGLFNDFFNVK